MRDWWYRMVAQNLSDGITSYELLKKIDIEVENIRFTHTEDVSELKRLLRENGEKTIESITPKNVSIATPAAITATRLADNVHANFVCKNCGTSIGLLIGSNECTTCHSPVV